MGFYLRPFQLTGPSGGYAGGMVLAGFALLGWKLFGMIDKLALFPTETSSEVNT
jgi:hypothetical protein